ncbi:MAG: hypothetical protein R3F59_23520 [Myxococcota bacterium]
MPVQQRREREVARGVAAGQHLQQHHAERVQVGALVDGALGTPSCSGAMYRKVPASWSSRSERSRPSEVEHLDLRGAVEVGDYHVGQLASRCRIPLS